MRASAAFAREASKFNARVSVHYDGMTASAASIMDLLMLGARVGQVIQIEAEGPEPLLAGYDGLLVPGGFGERGIEGMIVAARYAREKGINMYAVNSPRDVVKSVRTKGFENLTPEDAAHLPPKLATDNDEHRRMYRAFFDKDDALHMNEAALADTAAQSPNIRAWRCNVADWEDVQARVAEVERELGPVDRL